MRLFVCLLLLAACRATGSPGDPAAATPLPWTLGEWRGTRTEPATGDVAPMHLVALPILGGTGELQELEVETKSGVYHGLHLVVHDAKRDLWVSHYANTAGGRFSPLEGSPDGAGYVWRNAAPERTRESRLRDELLDSGRWRRTQEISEDNGTTWRVLFVDELERAGQAATAAKAAK